LARRFNTRPATNEDLSNADVSTSFFFGAMVTGKDAEIPPTLFPVWADVRDILVFIRITYEPILLQVRPVAQALYEIIVRQKNERYALCNGNVDYQILANTARELFPDLAKAGVIPFGKPEEKPSTEETYTIDGSKAERKLGLQCGQPV